MSVLFIYILRSSTTRPLLSRTTERICRYSYAVLPHVWAALPYAGRCAQTHTDATYDTTHDAARIIQVPGSRYLAYLELRRKKTVETQTEYRSQFQLYLGDYRAYTGTACFWPITWLAG